MNKVTEQIITACDIVKNSVTPNSLTASELADAIESKFHELNKA